MLPDQGSNLESTDSESGVLPIPPSGTADAKLEKNSALIQKIKFKKLKRITMINMNQPNY